MLPVILPLVTLNVSKDCNVVGDAHFLKPELKHCSTDAFIDSRFVLLPPFDVGLMLQRQQETTREGLMASIKRMEAEVDTCTQSIQALHADLDTAGKQNDEAREDSTAERFAGIK